MSLKDLFQQSEKAGESRTLSDFEEDSESSEYIQEYLDLVSDFNPSVDYTEPENFAFYGSAEEYYKNSIQRIYQTYPYDGSKSQKYDWMNKSSELDIFFLKNEYPTRTGFGIFGVPSWSPNNSATTTYSGITYHSSSDPSYIHFRGGPHTGSADDNDLTDNFDEFNVYESGTLRESNLKYDLDNGVTVEFWLKQGEKSPNTASTVFDLWNGEPSGSDSYGRYTIELSSSSDILLSYQSGTTHTVGQQVLSPTSSFDTTDWKHYSIRTYNSGSTVKSDLFVDGEHQDFVSSSFGSPFGEVTGGLEAYLGAFQTSPSGTQDLGPGWSSLSASVDEFRYWKTKKSAKEIGRNWNTHVHGGSNKKDTNVDLGVYYKFNEGITNNLVLDSTVLDYSGRVTNGLWKNYSTTATRSVSSAIEQATQFSEQPDPIIYGSGSHPDVSEVESKYRRKGEVYDIRNDSSMYDSFPQWMIEEDRDKETMLEMTQILASYFDTLQLQIESLNNIKDVHYRGKNDEILPFADRLIDNYGFVAPDIFSQAEAIEEFQKRTEEKFFEEELQEVKNSIYHNIYDNLVQIYKSKGTEKSIRNLIRCYGIDENVVNFKLYENNSDIKVEEKQALDDIDSNVINFNNPDNFDGTVFQQTSSNDPQSVSYISSSSPNADKQGQTIESEIIFPRKFKEGDSNYFRTPFLSSSLFGVHGVDSNDPSKIKFPNNETADLQVYAAKRKEGDDRAKFVLTSSQGIYPELTSSYYHNVYDQSRWTFGVTVKPEKEENISFVSGTQNSDYILEFYGVNSVADTVYDEFHVTSSIPNASGSKFLTSSKRVYQGAHATNFTGNVQTQTDIEASYLRYWFDSIDTDAIEFHNKYPEIKGQGDVYKQSFLNKHDLDVDTIPAIDLLSLDWSYESVTASNTSGEFKVNDMKSGSNNPDVNYGWLQDSVTRQHTGKGTNFLTESSTAAINESLDGYRLRHFENAESYDDVEISNSNTEEERFRRLRYKTEKSFRLEKSKVNPINDRILQWFGTVDEFNNLIGELKNRYRIGYKELGKLKELFYNKVDSVATVERYIKFYKWFDNSISKFIGELIPASADFAGNLENVIEDDILSREKYQSKYPTMEFEVSDPEVGVEGINDLKYEWEFGHAPIPLSEDENCFWWKQRVDRSNNNISSGDDVVDSDRNDILSASKQKFDRDKTKPYDQVHQLELGTPNQQENGTKQFIKALQSSSSPRFIKLSSGSFRGDEDCVDIKLPQTGNEKIDNTVMVKKFESGINLNQFGGNDILPFSFYRSDVPPSGNYLNNLKDRFRSQVELNDKNFDYYDKKSTDNILQSPFTKKLEGGMPHVETSINSGNVNTTGGLDTRKTRPEFYELLNAKIADRSGSFTAVVTGLSESHVAYYNPNKQNLKYKRRNASGSWVASGSEEDIDTKKDVGRWVNMDGQLKNQDSSSLKQLVATYLDKENSKVKVASKSVGGLTWSTETVDTFTNNTSSLGYPDIKVTEQGVYHLSYFDGNNLKYARKDSQGWYQEKFLPLKEDVEGKYSSIDLNKRNNPYIAYQLSGATSGTFTNVVKLQDHIHQAFEKSFSSGSRSTFNFTYGDLRYTEPKAHINDVSMAFTSSNKSLTVDIDYYSSSAFTNKLNTVNVISSSTKKDITASTSASSPHFKVQVSNSATSSQDISGTLQARGRWWDADDLYSGSASLKRGRWCSVAVTSTVEFTQGDTGRTEYYTSERKHDSNNLVTKRSASGEGISTGIGTGDNISGGKWSSIIPIHGAEHNLGQIFHFDPTSDELKINNTEDTGSGDTKILANANARGLDQYARPTTSSLTHKDYQSFVNLDSSSVQYAETGTAPVETVVSEFEAKVIKDLELKHAEFNENNSPFYKYYRDMVSRRPFNIDNVKSTKHDPLGNYKNIYQVVQSNDRSVQKSYFAKNDGTFVSPEGNEVSFGDINPELPYLRVSGSSGASFNHPIHEFSESKHVFAQRFSSPGETGSLSRGYLDVVSQQFSPYSTVNWRNLTVREVENDNWSTHFDPSDTGSYSASSKRPRNKRRIKDDDEADNVSEQYDNTFIGHDLVRTTFDYRWVTASAESGQQDDDLPYSYITSSDDITYLSASEERF